MAMEPVALLDVMAAALDALEEGIVVTDREGVVRVWSKGAERFYGWTADEAIGRSIFDLTVPEADARQATSIMSIVAAGQRWSGNFRVRRKDGSTFVAEVTDTPIRDDKGNIVAIVGQTRPGASVLSGLQLDLAMDAGNLGTWEWDVLTGHLTWSRSLEMVYGLQPGQFGGTYEEFTELVHPADRGFVSDLVRRALQTGEDLQFEHRIVRPDGSIRWMEARSVSVTDETGAVLRIRGVGVDITQRKRVEADQAFLAEASIELASSLDYEEMLRTAAHLPVPRYADWCVVYRLEDGIIRCVEVAFSETDDEAQRAFADHLKTTVQVLGEVQTNIARVIRTGQPLLSGEPDDAWLVQTATEEEHLRLRRQVPFKSSMVLPLVVRGSVLGAISLRIVRSGRRYGEDDLRLGEELARWVALALDNALHFRDAQEGARLREELVSIASHELRSPLTSIIGFTRRLWRQATQAEGPLDESAREELDIVLRESERMRNTLELFLNLARLEGGNFEINAFAVDLVDLLHDEVVAFTQRSPHVTVEERYAADAIDVTTDPDRLAQVVTNLLDNAAKYAGDHPRVSVEVTYEGPEVVIAVRDNGPGIAVEDQDQVFTRFYRSSAAGSQMRGLGLGLFISRQIIEHLEGSLTLQSTPGGGATFFIRIPRKPSSES